MKDFSRLHPAGLAGPEALGVLGVPVARGGLEGLWGPRRAKSSTCKASSRTFDSRLYYRMTYSTSSSRGENAVLHIMYRPTSRFL